MIKELAINERKNGGQCNGKLRGYAYNCTVKLERMRKAAACKILVKVAKLIDIKWRM